MDNELRHMFESARQDGAVMATRPNSGYRNRTDEYTDIAMKLVQKEIAKARKDEWDFAGDVIEAANQYSLDKYIEMRDQRIAELAS